MKKISKILSLLLAAIMVLTTCISTTVLADDTYTITVNDEATGHVYKVYQIFAGTLSSDKTTLTDVSWGSGVTAAEYTKAEGESYSSPLTAAEAMKYITETYKTADASNPESYWGDELKTWLSNHGVTLNTANEIDGSTYTEGYTKLTYVAATTDPAAAAYYYKDGYAAGYYLIIDDTTGKLASGDTYSSYMVQVVADSTVTVKKSAVSVDKQVDDKNDSTTDENGESWQDSADYDIGDAVPFKLTGTLPSNFEDYTTYTYTFHDTQDKGLTFNSSSVEVYATVGDKTYLIDSSCYSVKTGDDVSETQDPKCTFEVCFSNLRKDIKGTDTSDQTATSTDITLTAASVITVKYTSTLNDHANIGSTGNDNTVYLQYSNNPNADGTGTTPKKTVTVYTFEVSVHKVDSSGNPLGGANFTLYKLENDGQTTTWVEVSVESTTSADATGNKVIKTVEDESYTEVTTNEQGTEGTTEVVVTGSKFTFSGLDAGQYKLVETTTPDGYNTADDLIFTIVAEHTVTVTTGDDPELINLYITNSSGEVISNYYGDGTAPSTITFTVDTSTAGISTNIANYKGTELPETGGMGTKIFYTLGGILVVCAGVLLIVKRRMRNA
ncbi:MAG: isopeptide-forming domain-containing fimbrial protein [Clostridiales bacterium]|nr:isopeptide-forming domain-containing fimbrial protein [Clostridiales bacterium]